MKTEMVTALVLLLTTAAQPDIRSTVEADLVDLGFEVAEIAGGNLSLSAPAADFERVFQISLQRDDRGAIGYEDSSGTFLQDLPLTALPAAIRDHVAGIGFEPPMAFGPDQF